MKHFYRTLLIFVLAGCFGTARAEWVEIERFEDGMRVYVDAATARREGDLGEVRHLVNWGEPQEEPGEFTEAQIRKMTRAQLVDLYERAGMEVDDDDSRSEMAEKLLAKYGDDE